MQRDYQMDSVQINANQRRSLASVLNTVEQRLKEFGQLVTEAGDHPQARFSVEQTQELFERIAAAQKRVDDFRSRFKIPERRPRDPGWAIRVGVASLWELLEDSKSAAMRGYGEVPEATKPTLDAEVQNLIDALQDIAAAAASRN